MSSVIYVPICLLIVAAYTYLLFRLMLKKPQMLAVPAAVVFLVGVVTNFFGLDEIDSLAARSLLSVVYSAEFFFSHDHLYDVRFEIRNIFFQNVYSVTFVCAILTSFVFVIELLAKRFFSKLWLAFHDPRGRRCHIFYGINEHSALVARDIVSKDRGEVIIFLDPKKDKGNKSLSNVLTDRSAPDDAVISKYLKNSDYAILRSRCKISEVNTSSSDNIFSQIGLKHLSKFVNENTVFYVLSSDEQDNRMTVEVLSKCPEFSHTSIFCHANVRQDDVLAARRNTQFVDSSMLSIQELKRNSDLHPVNFVEIGRDSQGRKEGWVKSPFNALIVGFGETGQEALKFLYEFGAFAGKRQGKVIPRSEFKCRVVDANIDKVNFSANMEPGLVEYLKYDIADSDFWRFASEIAEEVNYVVVTLGDDATNLKVSQMLLNSFKNRNASQLAVLARVLDSSLIRFSDDRFHAFGSLENIWRENIISFKDIEDIAEVSYLNYLKTAGEPLKSWHDRHQEKLDALQNNNLDMFFKLNRREIQDISNCLHRPTKRILSDTEKLDKFAIAEGIPTKAIDRHYIGNDPYLGTVLEYLSVGEHIRWQAMYEARGFELGDKVNELARVHDCIKPYEDLDLEMQHYDWIVVKTSLIN